MNKLDLSSLTIDRDFIKIYNDKFKVIFTTAENGRSFNRATEEGIKEINSLKDEFAVRDIIYLKQIHSDKIYTYDYDKENIKDSEGDAIITKEKNVIIGVFTADCVPVILVDDITGVSAAIHSGWKGTFKSITLKTIEKMVSEFNVKPENIKAYIGAHIRKCCYEVSEELKEKFIEEKKAIKESELFEGRNLNLDACILDDLRKGGIEEENIYSLELCTYCENNIKLHSYRKSNGSYGRMLSFVILN